MENKNWDKNQRAEKVGYYKLDKDGQVISIPKPKKRTGYKIKREIVSNTPTSITFRTVTPNQQAPFQDNYFTAYDLLFLSGDKKGISYHGISRNKGNEFYRYLDPYWRKHEVLIETKGYEFVLRALNKDEVYFDENGIWEIRPKECKHEQCRYDTDKKYCIRCNVWIMIPQHNNDWREKFNSFIDFYVGFNFDHRAKKDLLNYVSSTIQSEVSKERERIIKEIKGCGHIDSISALRVIELIVNLKSPTRDTLNEGKENKVNNWEGGFRKKYNDMDVDEEIMYIKSLISSTEKRVAKDCIEICKDYIEEVNGCDDVKIIIKKIKSKYE